MIEFPDRVKHSSGRWMFLERQRLVAQYLENKAAGAERLRELGLIPESEGHAGASRQTGRDLVHLNNTVSRQWLRTVDGGPVDWERVDDFQRDRNSPLDWAAPVYRIVINDREDFLAIMPDALLIRVNPHAKDQELNSLLEGIGLSVDKDRSKYLGNHRYCRLSDPSGGTVFALIEKLIESTDVIQDVRFETMPMYVPTASIPDDPLYPDQWDMEQINAGGAGQTGWNIELGDPGVIICVLDEGCDLTHPDLTFTPAPSGINLGTMMPDGSPTGDHGTACAGIAAASINNTEGVAGVAGGCTILPAAVQNWTDVEIAAGIRYAADEGARVLSMSFGWDAWDPAIIDPAIQYAFDAGVIMCVATHNDDDDIRYPATNPLVMAIGASDQLDNRKSPTSPDGEWWWGSNFGPEISVVAPGVLCPTTDRQGAVGYNTSAGAAGNYVMDFNGTSSATPHVAGLAALLVSSDNTLTNVEVRAIIESTADKVGVVPYAIVPGYPNGTWNQEMGYGRINVLAALNVVRKRCELDLKALLVDVVKPYPEVVKIHTEKVPLEEVKSRVGYEIPDMIDPTIYEAILERLDRLERAIEQGQHFINRDERPNVGRGLTRRIRVRRR